MPTTGDKQLLAKVARLQKALISTVPKRLAADGQRHFMNSFRNQGFTDARLVLWPRLKKPRTSKGKPLQGRILKGRGLLANSIRVVRANWNSIQIAAGGPQVPYAKIHNEGGTIEGTASVRSHQRREHPVQTRAGRRIRRGGPVAGHTRKMLTYMPKRQYMGRSKMLDQTMRETILKTVVETLVK